MRRLVFCSSFAALIAVLVLVRGSAEVYGQAVECVPGGNHVPIDLGTPDAQGVTREDRLGNAGEKHGFYFKVPNPSASFVYVGDQWYDLDLFLYARGRCGANGFETLFRTWSVRAERRSLQFVRPDEQIIDLPPGEYLLLVGHKFGEDPQFAADFRPERGFTIRVALNPPTCKGALDPPNESVPNPVNPAVTMEKRPDAALYQLAMILDPPNPGPFSLITFNAVVSPPYTDLYDFEWQLDGRPVPDNLTPTLQTPSSALGRTVNNEHKVRVVAKGIRQYPDPDQPHIPPPLAVECTFKLGTT